MFGFYYFKWLLGWGGMGEVYEVEYIVKEWIVVVKLMIVEFSKDLVFCEWMKCEVCIVGWL